MSLIDIGDDAPVTERVLARLPSTGFAHIYKLPPRPSGGGWKCQEWPKTNHILGGRVVIVAKGEQCTIRLCDPEKGDALFAQCPLDNDNPQLSVEPCADSSRYFVLRVSDGSGRYAYLGLGFLERPDSFEFNVTLQDHVKHLTQEREFAAAAEAAANAPAPPPQDFSLKGSVSIALPGGATSAPKPRPAPAAGGGLAMPLMPPPPGGVAQPSRGRRGAPAPAAPTAPTLVAAAAVPPAGGGAPPAADPFGFGDAFGGGATADPFGASPFSTPTAATTTPNPFGDATPFGATDPFAFGGTPSAGGGAAPASNGGNGWVAF
jgi:hypothetical protein